MFIFFLASIWFPITSFCLKGVIKIYVYSLLDYFCIPFSSILMFFNIFTANGYFDIFKKIFQAKTSQNRTNKPKRLLSLKNSKLFGSLQLLVIPEHAWEPLMSYIGFILSTIYTYVIWMKVFFVKNRNGFCLETSCFLWFPSTFCSEFFFSLNEETEFFLFSLGSLFCYLCFLDDLWNSYQLLLILLIGEWCLIWRFHLVSFSILN